MKEVPKNTDSQVETFPNVKDEVPRHGINIFRTDRNIRTNDSGSQGWGKNQVHLIGSKGENTYNLNLEASKQAGRQTYMCGLTSKTCYRQIFLYQQLLSCLQ